MKLLAVSLFFIRLTFKYSSQHRVQQLELFFRIRLLIDGSLVNNITGFELDFRNSIPETGV